MRLKQILLTLMATLLFVVAAHAHEAALLKSEPVNGRVLAQSPAQVRAWFGEEIQSATSALQVFNAAGERVDDGSGGVDLTDPDHASMLVNLPPLPEGEYRVRWYVVLIDGDASESAFNFYVGDETSAVASGFAPADTTVLYYQAETEAETETEPVPWLIIGGGVIIIALIVPLASLWRRKPQ
jgi:methionine-rich copper-binding protein CopC